MAILGGCISEMLAFFMLPLVFFWFVKLIARTNLQILWQKWFGDYTLAAILHLIYYMNGNFLLSFLVLGMGTWVFSRMIFALPVAFGSYAARWQLQTASRQPSVQDVHARLRTLFSDDTAKIALIETQYARKGRGSTRNTYVLGCSGCLFSIVWVLLSVPLVFCVQMALFDGIRRIFVEHETTTIGQVSARLGISVPYLQPAPDSAFGIQLYGHDWKLVLLLGVLVFADWLLANTSRSGWTLPKVAGKPTWIFFAAWLLLTGYCLNGCFVFFLVCGAAISFCVRVLWSWLARGIYLTARAAVFRRQAEIQ